MINSHMRCHPDIKEGTTAAGLLEESSGKLEGVIAQEMLKKYVLYAKRFIHPKLSDIDKDKITQFYTELRKEAGAVGGLPIGVRHVESILRMAESHARMHLREYVRGDDVDLAIKMMLESFLMTQKYSVSRGLMKKFAHYLAKEKDSEQLLLHILERMIREKLQYMQLVQSNSDICDVAISRAQFEQEARDFNVPDINKFLKGDVFTAKFLFQKNMIKLK